jgi:hypothetical protein
MSTPFQGLRISQGHPCPANAIKAIEEFFNTYCLDDVHYYINEMLVTSLITNTSSFDTGQKRSNAIFFCEQAWYLIQAVHTLDQQEMIGQ